MTPKTERLLGQDDPFLEGYASEDVPDVMETSDAEMEHSDDVPVSSTEDSGIVFTPDVKTSGSKLMLRLPKSVYERLMKQKQTERRMLRVVVEKAIEDFLDKGESEPRPYIPSHLKIESKVETQMRIDDELSVGLEVRANVEERSRNALALRAILDYLEIHEGRDD